MKGNPPQQGSARRKQDLANVGLTATKSYAGSDYPWRTILPSRAELMMLLEKLGNSVNYPNFKGRIGERPDQRLAVVDLAEKYLYGY